MEWFLSSGNKIPVFRKAVRVTLKRAVISLMFNLRPLVLEKKKKKGKLYWPYIVSVSRWSRTILATKREKVLEILSWREMKYNETVRKSLERFYSRNWNWCSTIVLDIFLLMDSSKKKKKKRKKQNFILG